MVKPAGWFDKSEISSQHVVDKTIASTAALVYTAMTLDVVYVDMAETVVTAVSTDVIHRNPNTIFNVSVYSSSSSSSVLNDTAGLDGTAAVDLEGALPLDIEVLLTDILGAKRKELPSVLALSVVYLIIFFTGVIGNVSTCIVIARNSYMRTPTNYYLFSLALSDLLTLLFGKPSIVSII